MGAYPPPPPYGNDWKYQRRVLKEQARVQRDYARAQREAYRYQLRGQRRSSILGPLVLIALGVIFLLVQTGHLDSHRLWDWYSRFWPLILVGAGIIMLAEWGFDQYMQSDPDKPRYRRGVGGGVFTMLLLLGLTGLILSGIREGGTSKVFPGLNLNQDNMDEFLGDKHESDQTLSQAFPTGSSFTINNPRGDVSITGTSDDNQIHVAVHKQVYTRSDSDADSKAEHLSPSLTSNGSSLVLSVPALDGARADITVTLPAAAPITITANHGDVHVTAIKAPVQITANHGDVELAAITGDVIARVNNGDSDFSAHSVTGALSIEGHGHDTTLSDLSGPLTMRGDFFGTTHFERIRGPIKFHTIRTDFQLARLDGEIDISNNADLTASNALGPVTLTTGNRNITLDRIAGDLAVINRNGSVDVTSAPPLSNLSIENRNGSVSVTLPEKANFAYQLEATNGNIDGDFSQIKTDDDSRKNTLSGTIGNGGPLLRITTTQGDVELKQASIMPLPPMPPMPPKITVIPPDAQQSIKDANKIAQQAMQEAQREAKQAGAEAAAEARKATKNLNHRDKDDDNQ
ncbi:DUF4097 family beta strand repeat-containing protein [Granulicella sp. L60]|uniref:DUF4097 family beta strand repeat-containing protein n=1 Tax=Granulicella sp. L60 TaxID=1641866 RepID=UPI00131E0496|nr:DUF4097 family beta strand repeat-containing protein [Granulicella sp. L60]